MSEVVEGFVRIVVTSWPRAICSLVTTELAATRYPVHARAQLSATKRIFFRSPDTSPFFVIRKSPIRTHVPWMKPCDKGHRCCLTFSNQRIANSTLVLHAEADEKPGKVGGNLAGHSWEKTLGYSRSEWAVSSRQNSTPSLLFSIEVCA